MLNSTRLVLFRLTQTYFRLSDSIADGWWGRFLALFWKLQGLTYPCVRMLLPCVLEQLIPVWPAQLRGNLGRERGQFSPGR